MRRPVALMCVIAVAGALAMIEARQRPAIAPGCGRASAIQQLDADGVQAFVDCARAATRKYQRRDAAVADGYRPIGRDFPAMGAHWIHVGRLFDNRIDPAQPEVLNYIDVSGTPVLAGVAYALPLLKGETPPEWPAGRSAWHDHFRTIEDETVLPDHHMSGQAGDAARVAMVHAWLWTDNPDGLFAADNWALPYSRLGIAAPTGAPVDAAKALSLPTGGALYFQSAIDAAARPSAEEKIRLDAAFASALTATKKLVEVTPRTFDAETVARLAAIWGDLWTAIDAALGPAVRMRLMHLAIR